MSATNADADADADATFLTTGEAAKICRVAPRTICKWFDAGRLKGRRLPGTLDRRIDKQHFLAFLADHGIDPS